MMSAHKLTAGHGYTYLTSQVAAQDAGMISRGGLGAYYSERGESPGQWLGSGLRSLDIERGLVAREDQMIALFGEGRHPDTATLTRDLRARGADGTAVAAATALGRPFDLNLANSEYLRMVAQLTAEWNRAQRRPRCAAAPAGVRSMIHTIVAEEVFAQRHNRQATDAGELAGFIAARSRIGSRAVAEELFARTHNRRATDARTRRIHRGSVPHWVARSRGLRPDLLPGQERLGTLGCRPTASR